MRRSKGPSHPRRRRKRKAAEIDDDGDTEMDPSADMTTSVGFNQLKPKPPPKTKTKGKAKTSARKSRGPRKKRMRANVTRNANAKQTKAEGSKDAHVSVAAASGGDTCDERLTFGSPFSSGRQLSIETRRSGDRRERHWHEAKDGGFYSTRSSDKGKDQDKDGVDSARILGLPFFCGTRKNIREVSVEFAADSGRNDWRRHAPASMPQSKKTKTKRRSKKQKPRSTQHCGGRKVPAMRRRHCRGGLLIGRRADSNPLADDYCYYGRGRDGRRAVRGRGGGRMHFRGGGRRGFYRGGYRGRRRGGDARISQRAQRNGEFGNEEFLPFTPVRLTAEVLRRHEETLSGRDYRRQRQFSFDEFDVAALNAERRRKESAQSLMDLCIRSCVHPDDSVLLETDDYPWFYEEQTTEGRGVEFEEDVRDEGAKQHVDECDSGEEEEDVGVGDDAEVEDCGDGDAEAGDGRSESNASVICPMPDDTLYISAKDISPGLETQRVLAYTSSSLRTAQSPQTRTESSSVVPVTNTTTMNSLTTDTSSTSVRKLTDSKSEERIVQVLDSETPKREEKDKGKDLQVDIRWTVEKTTAAQRSAKSEDVQMEGGYA